MLHDKPMFDADGVRSGRNHPARKKGRLIVDGLSAVDILRTVDTMTWHRNKDAHFGLIGPTAGERTFA